MPLVKVEMLEGKSKEFRKTVLDCIHDGLMDSIGIEDWDRFQRIAEYEKDNFEITVAGLSKSKAKDWLLDHGGMSQFKPGTIVPEGSSGRTVATYNDWADVVTINVNGEEILVGSNMVITDTTYQFTLSEDYNDLLQNIANGVLF